MPYLFRLLAGQHVENDVEGVERKYVAGAEFVSKYNLLLLNGEGVPPKFERVDAHTPLAVQVQAPAETLKEARARIRSNLEAMKVEDIETYAQKNEIDLKGVKNKEDAIKRILAA